MTREHVDMVARSPGILCTNRFSDQDELYVIFLPLSPETPSWSLALLDNAETMQTGHEYADKQNW